MMKTASKDKVVTVETIMTKGSKRRAPEKVEGKADIVRGKSIRIYGCEYAGTSHERPFDHTFEMGGVAVYGGYNLTYTGTVVSITEKTVIIEEEHSSRRHNMDLAKFLSWNRHFNLAEISARNADTMQHI